MTARRARVFALALGLATALPAASPGQDAAPTIRWEVDPSGKASAVSVEGLRPGALEALRGPGWADDRWPELLAIVVDLGRPAGSIRPGMLGSYRVEGAVLRFTPRYPFDPGRAYVATFRPAALPGGGGGGGPAIASRYVVPKPQRAATSMTQVAPTGDRVPENLLKFYLTFSAPMSRGEVDDRVRLLKADGRAVDLPFLRLAEELWDPTGTRLTLLIDPGRIKRGSGPARSTGRSWRPAGIIPWWSTPDGPTPRAPRSPRRSARPSRAEGPDDAQPDPSRWAIDRPAASTRDPLGLSFPEPLDRALIESALTLVDPAGGVVDGRLEVDRGETRWRFTPDRPWSVGEYAVLIDPDLEDLAGNSIRRPFEVDVQRDTPIRPDSRPVRLPIAIRAKGR